MINKSKNNFANRVYNIVKEIPPGKVSTYRLIAKKLGTKAYRAVGQALKKNKSTEVPCFRVVKSSGDISGYKGSSPNNIKKKIKKLKSEGIIVKGNKINLKRYIYKF